MDLICGEDFDDNFLYIYAYIRSDTTTVPSGLRIDCEKVRLYYNINDSGWKSDNYVDYDVNDYYIPAIFKYQLNLYETGLHCGDTIKLYLVAFRSNSNSADNTFYNSSSMNFGVSPMYYLQPDEYLGTNAQYYEYTLNQTHDWTAWSVKTQPTCTTKGTESRTCYNCDAEETRDYGSALGHNYNDATCELPATCQRQGCSATCGSALGHNYNDATCELPATCQRQGCSATCGSALGHNYNDATCELPAT
ncbi:MAG TPA: hypothetical protein PLH71_01945, partial [Clostridia bacterium]|nr:hypothetical protein [Clostridia bacterium]